MPGRWMYFRFRFFSLVFSSIGFPIEKKTRNFGVRKKLLLFFYYYLGQWNSLFFVTVFIWAVFFSLGFLFFSLEQCLNADRGNSSNGEIFYVSLPLRRQLEELYSHPLYAIDMNWKNKQKKPINLKNCKKDPKITMFFCDCEVFLSLLPKCRAVARSENLGGHIVLVGIMCPPPCRALVEIGLTDLPKRAPPPLFGKSGNPISTILPT